MRNLLAARRAARFESRIVWIFGSPRSGSTWVWGMLKDIECVVAVNEPMIGYYLGPFTSDAPGVRVTDLDTTNFTVRRVQADRPHQFFATKYQDVWLPALRHMLNARFRAHVEREGPGISPKKAVLVVKEPNGSQSADIIMEAQPMARLLFLLRDGRDVVDSRVDGSQEGGWPSVQFPGIVGVPTSERLDFLVSAAYKWLWQTEVVQQAFAAHPGPKMLLRYEDLRKDPERHMTELLAWLGLPAQPEVVRALVERHSFERIPESDRGPKKFYRAATPGLWQQNLTTEEQESLEAIVGPKLRELGYDG
jgi:hypothetical protein